MVYVIWYNGGPHALIECCDIKNNSFLRAQCSNGGVDVTTLTSNSDIFSYDGETFTINTVNYNYGVFVIAI